MKANSILVSLLIKICAVFPPAISPCDDHIMMSTDYETEYSVVSPVQVSPSPVYPGEQAQENVPGVLVHRALLSQLCVPLVHSLMSRKNKSVTIVMGCMTEKHALY